MPIPTEPAINPTSPEVPPRKVNVLPCAASLTSLTSLALLATLLTTTVGASACDTLFPKPVVPVAHAVADGDAAGLADALTPTNGADAGSADVPSVDAEAVDGASVDTGSESDAATVVDANTKPDVCAWPDCEPTNCDSLRATIDEIVGQNTGCSDGGGCNLFEFPICGSIGCYTKPIASSAAPETMEELNALALIGQKLQCPDFHCGCDVPPKPYCLGGDCRQCPPDCGTGCQGLLAAIQDQAQKLGGYCQNDADCTGIESPICTAPGLPCYLVMVHAKADTQQIKALMKAYTDNKCVLGECDCAAPQQFACVGGKCEAAAP